MMEHLTRLHVHDASLLSEPFIEEPARDVSSSELVRLHSRLNPDTCSAASALVLADAATELHGHFLSPKLLLQ